MKPKPVPARVNSAFCIQFNYTSQQPPKCSSHPLTIPVHGHHHMAPWSSLCFTLIHSDCELNRSRYVIQICGWILSCQQLDDWVRWTVSYSFVQTPVSSMHLGTEILWTQTPALPLSMYGTTPLPAVYQKLENLWCDTHDKGRQTALGAPPVPHPSTYLPLPPHDLLNN